MLVSGACKLPVHLPMRTKSNLPLVFAYFYRKHITRWACVFHSVFKATLLYLLHPQPFFMYPEVPMAIVSTMADDTVCIAIGAVDIPMSATIPGGANVPVISDAYSARLHREYPLFLTKRNQNAANTRATSTTFCQSFIY